MLPGRLSPAAERQSAAERLRDGAQAASRLTGCRAPAERRQRSSGAPALRTRPRSLLPVTARKRFGKSGQRRHGDCHGHLPAPVRRQPSAGIRRTGRTDTAWPAETGIRKESRTARLPKRRCGPEKRSMGQVPSPSDHRRGHEMRRRTASGPQSVVQACTASDSSCREGSPPAPGTLPFPGASPSRDRLADWIGAVRAERRP